MLYYLLQRGTDCDGYGQCCLSVFDNEYHARIAQALSAYWSDGMTYQLTTDETVAMEYYRDWGYTLDQFRDEVNYSLDYNRGEVDSLLAQVPKLQKAGYLS